MGDGSDAKKGRKRDHSYDEVFKTLGKHSLAHLFTHVNTDYELLFGSKRIDLMLAKPKGPLKGKLTILSHFKEFNLIEFKSEKDRFKGNKDLGKVYYYYGGVIEQEEEATIENTSFTLICSIKPNNFLKYYKSSTKKAGNGIYLIKGILVIPLYIIVPDEVEGELNQEVALLKEFSRGKERQNYLREILHKVLQGENEYTCYLNYAFSLYKDELLKIAQEEGLNMTLIERNLQSLIEDFNLKEKFIKEGKMDDARKMLEKGLEVDFINEITGLSTEEIIALIEPEKH